MSDHATRGWWGRIVSRFTTRRDRLEEVAAPLARDLGIPPDATIKILDRATTDIRRLSASDGVDSLLAVLDRAAREAHEAQEANELDCTPPFVEAMDRCVRELAPRDYQLLLYYRSGLSHQEIAALMGTAADSVLDSLSRIYADLRTRTMGDAVDVRFPVDSSSSTSPSTQQR